LPFLPKIAGRYDLAVSFYGPHYTAAERVDATIKIGWIHTDYRLTPNDGLKEEAMWDKLDKIAAVSDECRERFIEQFPKLSRKTMVIENILSPDLVRRQAAEFSVGDEMPSESGVTRILTVGRFCHQKAFDDAVLACRKLVDKGSNVRWYAIGYGPEEALIRRLIEDNQLSTRFVILGKKVNPYPYMRICDLYVQPSRYEGKAVTVREAQILGKPVLITRFSTSASQIEDGIDGLVCDLGVDGIVTGVRRLIEDVSLREQMAANASKRDYSNRGEVQKIYSLLRR
jgi:glycosyltransferase involved in cell wall biosynthesis